MEQHLNPKEKAQELVEKYAIWSWNETYCDYNMAKELALIAVDEVLNDDWFIPNREDSLARKKYWEEVKKEINNL